MYQFFAPRSSSKSPLRLPQAYRDNARWHPRLGDTFPYCKFNTNAGVKSIADLAGRNWVYFFSLPQAFTPVCTAELAGFARLQHDFDALGVTLLCFSQSTVQLQKEWHAMLDTRFGIKVNIACIEDPELALARCFGIVHPRECNQMMIRKSFVLDPRHTIRSLVEYPAGIMRNAAEAIDHIKNLQDLDGTALQLGRAPVQGGDYAIERGTTKPVTPRRVMSNPAARIEPLKVKKPAS